MAKAKAKKTTEPGPNTGFKYFLGVIVLGASTWAFITYIVPLF